MNEIVKQPNGKYSRVSITGMVLFSDYTKEEVINEYVELAIYRANKDIENARVLGGNNG